MPVHGPPYGLRLWVTNDTVLLLAEELEQLFDPAHVPVVQAGRRDEVTLKTRPAWSAPAVSSRKPWLEGGG